MMICWDGAGKKDSFIRCGDCWKEQSPFLRVIVYKGEIVRQVVWKKDIQNLQNRVYCIC